MDGGSFFYRSFGAPGARGTLVFLHATGLNASAYVPLLQDLPFMGQLLAPSLRGHGATDLPADPKTLRSWQLLANDLAKELFRREIREPLLLAGHSAGAVTALLLARKLRCERVLMIEPVVLPRSAVMLARSPLRRFTVARTAIARRAAARRRHFPSRAEAIESYRRKPFFSRWHPDALAGYAEEGFRAGPDGGVVLSCDPQWEAACFAAQAHGFWPHLRAVLEGGTSVSILAAEGRSTFPAAYHDRARRMGAEVTPMDGGHMLPVEEPTAVGGWLSARS